MKQTDLVSVWVVYRNPKDFPGKFVLREQRAGWDFEKNEEIILPSPLCVVEDTYEKLSKHIPFGLFRLNRMDADDYCILETWI